MQWFRNGFAMVSHRSWLDSPFTFKELLLKHKIWKWKYYRSKYENFLCSYQKIKTDGNGIRLQCSGFIEILDMFISGLTRLKTWWIWLNSKHLIKSNYLAIYFLLAVINMWYTQFSVSLLYSVTLLYWDMTGLPRLVFSA